MPDLIKEQNTPGHNISDIISTEYRIVMVPSSLGNACNEKIKIKMRKVEVGFPLFYIYSI